MNIRSGEGIIEIDYENPTFSARQRFARLVLGKIELESLRTSQGGNTIAFEVKPQGKVGAVEDVIVDVYPEVRRG